jgi:hypothetical protein
MSKKACMSNCKDPENHSKKTCTCGGHSSKAQHAKPKGKRPERGGRPSHVPVLG